MTGSLHSRAWFVIRALSTCAMLIAFCLLGAIGTIAVWTARVLLGSVVITKQFLFVMPATVVSTIKGYLAFEQLLKEASKAFGKPSK